MSGENNKPWYKKPEIMVILITAIIAAISAIVAAYIGIIPDIDQEFATVQGIVTDNGGEPVIDALVEIDGSSVTTGSDGGYVIHGVPIGTKTITVRVSGVEVVMCALRISKDQQITRRDIILPLGTPTPTATTPTPTATTPTPTATTPTPTATTPTPTPTTPTPTPTVTPTPEVTVTEEPEVTPTPTPTVTIKIAEPKDGDTVYDDPVIVSGTVKNFTNEVRWLWACVKSYDDIWYPQGTLTMTGEETWVAVTRPGIPTNPADIGKKFDIVVLVAAEEVDKELRKTLRGEGNIADGWGLSALPEGANIRDQITVILGT